MSRVEDDKTKLIEAVGIFRVEAKLIDSASDEALVAYAHGSGQGKRYADMVRTAWHDYMHARYAVALPVTPYVIEYKQTGLFEQGERATKEEPPPPTDTDAPEGGDPDHGERASTVDAAAGSSPENPFCPHKVRVNSGKSVVCDDCGEVLEELPECSHEGTTKRGHDDPNRWVCTACGEDVGEAPQEVVAGKRKARKPKPPDDQEEILF